MHETAILLVALVQFRLGEPLPAVVHEVTVLLKVGQELDGLVNGAWLLRAAWARRLLVSVGGRTLVNAQGPLGAHVEDLLAVVRAADIHARRATSRLIEQVRGVCGGVGRDDLCSL